MVFSIISCLSFLVVFIIYQPFLISFIQQSFNAVSKIFANLFKTKQKYAVNSVCSSFCLEPRVVGVAICHSSNFRFFVLIKSIVKFIIKVFSQFTFCPSYINEMIIIPTQFCYSFSNNKCLAVLNVKHLPFKGTEIYYVVFFYHYLIWCLYNARQRSSISVVRDSEAIHCPHPAKFLRSKNAQF